MSARNTVHFTTFPANVFQGLPRLALDAACGEVQRSREVADVA
jgi:hypothetical protein